MRSTSYAYYEELWSTLQKIPSKQQIIKDTTQKVLSGKPKYLKVEQKTNVPWQIVGIIHSLESSSDWNSCLHNGQPWNQKTTKVPKDRGPWNSWEEAAEDALNMHSSIFPKYWTIGGSCKFLERYNGTGYAKINKNSPYLYSFSNHGVGSGKYIADKTYDPYAQSKQCGGVVILKELYELGETLPGPLIVLDPSSQSLLGKIHQKSLNEMAKIIFGNKYQIDEDGKVGKITSELTKIILGFNIK